MAALIPSEVYSVSSLVSCTSCAGREKSRPLRSDSEALQRRFARRPRRCRRSWAARPCYRCRPGEIRRARSEANFEDDAGAKGRVPAEPLGKRASPNVACPSDAQSILARAAGSAVCHNRAKTLPGDAVGFIRRAGWRVKTEIPAQYHHIVCDRSICRFRKGVGQNCKTLRPEVARTNQC